MAFDASLEERDAIEFPSLLLTIRTRYDYLTPVITGVSDSRREIEEGGTTFDDAVTFKGTATRGERVELFDATSQSMGTADVNAASAWECELKNLTERLYRINAKALYDAVPVSSEPRTFTVNFAMTPTIDSVTDSKGQVAPGGSTYDNVVTLTGSANPDQKVEILDDAVSKGTLDVDARGKWELHLTVLAVAAHNITAKALYDVDPISSPVRSFRVLQTITPTISSVTDIRGAVNNGGTTYYTAAALSGKASPNEQIQLLDNNVPIGNPINVTAAGTWTYELKNLTLNKTYRLTAKALYSNEPVSTPPWNFTVAAMIAPTITSVTDSAGGLVQNNATTYFSSLIMQGRATPRERLTLLDSGASPRTVNIDAGGNWRYDFNSLTAKRYSITARAEYTVNPGTSPERVFTVASHVAPTITSVRDSRGELQDGFTTIDSSVSVSGRVTPSHQVQIYDNNVPGSTLSANASGEWSATNIYVQIGGHSINAKALATGQTSNTRRFTVQSPIPPLNFNESTVTLAGKVYMAVGGVLPSFGAGTSVQHVASGGRPGYTYASSNSAVAVVESNGRVTVRSKGSAYISATDTVGQSKRYLVNVTGAIQCIDLSAGTYGQIVNAASAAGARVPSIGELREIYSVYAGRWPTNPWYYWSNSVHSQFIIRKMWTKQLNGGGESPQPDSTVHARGLGLR